MSATSGISTRSFISDIACAERISGTATRTMSQPAAANSRICAAVASASHVLVLHIDCKETFAPPPTATPPTFILFVFSLFISLSLS